MDGQITSGKNHSEQFMPLISDLVFQELGFHPFPGTLNLDGVEGLDMLSERVVEDPSLGMDNCQGVTLRPCSVAGVRGGVVRPLVDGYPENKVEVIAPVGLRTLFGVADGDTLSLSVPDDLAAPGGPSANATALDEFAAVVFDLDHTLVELAVDWEAVREDVIDLLEEHLPTRPLEDSEVVFREIAREQGLWDEFTTTVAEYETLGAREATQLRLLDVVSALDCPVGICTRNSEEAAELVLERFGVRDDVDAIVARETVPEQKPHPKPLEYCFELLDTAPGNAVFIGDEESDLQTARRTGTSFFYPHRLETPS